MHEVQAWQDGQWVTVWQSHRREFAIMRLASLIALKERARIIDENGIVDTAAQERVTHSLSLAGIA